MRILVVGAGAIGGYFGGRLLEKGKDVTFLVREKKQKKLDKEGLIVKSSYGDICLPATTITSYEKSEPFDVVMISTKAYHLADAMNDIQPFINEETMILPLLNGVSHIDDLTSVFGEERVIGGLCFIESTLAEDGTVVHTSPMHELVFGERSGESTQRILALEKVFSGTVADIRRSDQIMTDVWQKYLFIATMSGVTSLFRSTIGPIREQPTGMATIKGLLAEAYEIMTSAGMPVDSRIIDVQLNKINSLNANMKSSLQRDMEKGQPLEAEHFFGYLLQKAKEKELDTPVLSSVYANLKVFENTKQTFTR
ncbi:ketopantoate reductase family protein [Cytobacillus purgationiresistens]|uniref:2-dehydropantoate 2-reductase n=1 Tax=Cytobacillus purgationiresistens TaxID=863449 RepID=A0ABU0AJN0_9BACI|nr:ketopantoate reductase family protein [Cytobacillus purgationiresistens]MDQ0271480.1 2-dehydropantoate 2-reductase [Cytobacillus purgationiresistens]